MGIARSNPRRLLVRRNTSMVKTRLQRSAAYVTPQRMGGRVAPTKSGSAVSPELRSSMTGSPSDRGHAAHPGHDLWGTEGNDDSKEGCDGPPPGDAIGHRHRAEHHHQDDRQRREPGENIRLQGRKPCIEWGLRERKLRQYETQ